MKYFQYIQIHRKFIPEEILDKYGDEIDFDDKGFVRLDIRRGMYGLKESGFIAFDQLV